VTRNATFAAAALPALVDHVRLMRKSRFAGKDGCFCQGDASDGMEYSISGNGCRPSIAAMMVGEAVALSKLADVAGAAFDGVRREFAALAVDWRRRLIERNWNSELDFFTTRVASSGPRLCRNAMAINNARAAKKGLPIPTCPPAWAEGELVPVRELIGISAPFYFDALPPPPGSTASAVADTTNGGGNNDDDDLKWRDNFAAGFDRVFDFETGFFGRFGPRVVEKQARCFNFTHYHECLWNGPSWPLETSRLLSALANYINDYQHAAMTMTATHFVRLLRSYTRAHTRSHISPPPVPRTFTLTAPSLVTPAACRDVAPDDATLERPSSLFTVDGRTPWIDENIDADTGEWLARRTLQRNYAAAKKKGTQRKLAKKGPPDRGADYLHSTYIDVVVSGLVGLRPRADDTLEINPLVGGDGDNNGDTITHFALDGVYYHGHYICIVYDRDGAKYERGLRVWVDGFLVASEPTLRRVTIALPPSP
jgi:hypothetical protein